MGSSSIQAVTLVLRHTDCCIMSGAPPSAEALAAKSGDLKKAETKVQDGHAVDEAVLKLYKKTFADNSGDKDKICKALDLDAAKWVDGGEGPFLAKYLGVK